jgi:hypothetical protein
VGVADSARVFELQAGHERDVAEAGVADDEHDRLALRREPLRLVFHMHEIGLREERELLGVVRRIEVLLVERPLTGDRVEVEAAARHACTRRH